MNNWRMMGFAVSAAVAVLSVSANAETQEVAGVVWTYQPCEGGVAIASGHIHRPAIPSNTVGAVVIPSQLGGQPVVKIGKYAFYGCDGVSAVAMSNDVNEVCDYAFRSCSNLVSVALSSNIVDIGSSAFRDCIRLQSVPLVNALTNVGSSAFANCRELSSVNLPPGLLRIDTSAFDACSNIVSVAMPPQFSVKKVFPDSYARITTVTLPDDATEICASAFEGCKSLVSVNMPSNLTSVGSKAFRDCSKLTSANLPTTVTVIGEEAFMNCTLLQSVVIPNLVVSVGTKAFAGCKNIVTVAVPSNVVLKEVFPDCYAKVVSVTLPDDATEICASAFEGCKSLVSVNMPSNLTSLGTKAFSGCTGLTSLTLPEGLHIIGSEAFSKCNSLTLVILPESVAAIGAKAFAGCKNIMTVAVPSNVVLKEVFPDSYAKIVTVTLPDDATEIRVSAFEGCKSLASVNMPSNLASIGANAFKGCAKLTSVNLPAEVAMIGAAAFMNCTSLQFVEIPDSVVSFGEKVFGGCKAIVSVAVAPKFKLKSLFPDSYTKISSVTLLPGPDTVCEDAFKGCKKIVSITISEGVVSIGDDAFNGCSDLQEVILPNSLVEIGKRAFRGCGKIATVSLPARFCVGDVFSSSCKQLESVTILPDSGDVPAKAFYKCSELSSIFFQSPTPPKLSEDALLGVLESVRIVVPTGSVAAYVVAQGWKSYARQIEAEGEYPILYSLHGGVNAADNPLSYRIDQLPFALGNPNKAGGVFDGWYMKGSKVAEIPVGTTGCISLSASWRIAEPIAPPTADYVTYKAQYDGIVWDVAENRLVGVLRLKSTKMNEKTRAVKISGYLLGLDGKKKSVKQNAKKLFAPESGPLTADFTVKDIGQMTLVVGGDTIAGTLEGYEVRTFAVGGDWIRDDAVANAEATVFEGIPGTVQMRLLPVDEPVMQKKGKWAFNKAATVSWKKPRGESVKRLVVDTSKNKTNLSGIKLTYTPKTGAFKGSFKIHALEDKVTRNEKTKALKKYTVKVTGVVIDGIGYGKAVLKKPANEWTLSVD